jgi:hypothetical protein
MAHCGRWKVSARPPLFVTETSWPFFGSRNQPRKEIARKAAEKRWGKKAS